MKREKEPEASCLAAGKMNCWWQPQWYLQMFHLQMMTCSAKTVLVTPAMERKPLESPTTMWGTLGGLQTLFVAPVLGYLNAVHIKSPTFPTQSCTLGVGYTTDKCIT